MGPATKGARELTRRWSAECLEQASREPGLGSRLCRGFRWTSCMLERRLRARAHIVDALESLVARVVLTTRMFRQTDDQAAADRVVLPFFWQYRAEPSRVIAAL